jgi:hypothetical protein
LDRKNIQSVGTSFGNIGKHAIIIKDGILLSDNKWESDWDAIGNTSRMAAGSFAYTPRPTYSNHSKGWASNGAHFRT